MISDLNLYSWGRDDKYIIVHNNTVCHDVTDISEMFPKLTMPLSHRGIVSSQNVVS
jgi:hypothetical protein